MEKPSCILSQEFVNKLSDFLCGEISENHKFKTKLSVIDVNTFFIIKGSTQSKTVQILSELVDKFIATPFPGDERHVRRINLMAKFEDTGKI